MWLSSRHDRHVISKLVCVIAKLRVSTNAVHGKGCRLTGCGVNEWCLCSDRSDQDVTMVRLQVVSGSKAVVDP